MSPWPETVAMVVGVWKEMLKEAYVMFAVHDSPEQAVVGVFGDLICSGISRAIQAEPDPSEDGMSENPGGSKVKCYALE